MHPQVLIIGGGVIGLSIARQLHRSGVDRIVIIEKGVCCEESSWAAAGMLAPQAETDEPGRMLDLCVESRKLFPDFASSLFDETGVDIELDRRGTLNVFFNEFEATRLQDRVSWQIEAGLNASIKSVADVRHAEPLISPDVIGAAFFPDDWQVDNRKLCIALRRYAELNGITVLENDEVLEIVFDEGRVNGVVTASVTIRSESTILATGAWSSLIKTGSLPIAFSIKPVRGQMIMYRKDERLFQHVIYGPNGYLVPRIDGRILVGASSEDVGYVKENTVEQANELKANAEMLVPYFAGLKIVDQWSGLRPRSSDGLPVLGCFEGFPGLQFATGHYRNGILLAPLTAELIANSIVNGERSIYLSEFGPDRFRVANAVA